MFISLLFPSTAFALLFCGATFFGFGALGALDAFGAFVVCALVVCISATLIVRFLHLSDEDEDEDEGGRFAADEAGLELKSEPKPEVSVVFVSLSSQTCSVSGVAV
jgi:hypothetical protein